MRGAQCFKRRRGFDRAVSPVSQLLQERCQQLLGGHVRIRAALNMRALIYDIIFHSYAGILNEVITITSILISIWRFGWKNLGDPNSGFSQKRIDSDSE